MNAADPRRGLAAAVFGLVAAASHAVQRLAGALEPVDVAAVLAQEHIPFTWRTVLALFHGALAAGLVLFGLDDQAATRWLARVPLLVGLVVLPLAVLMAIAP